MPLTLCSRFDYVGRAERTWSVWLDGTRKELAAVCQVVYTLPASYPNQIRPVKKRRSMFRLDVEAQSEFEIQARVHGRDGSQIDLTTRLRFPSGWRRSESIARAVQILDTHEGEPQDLLALATKLQAEQEFGYARRLLARARRGVLPAANAQLRVTLAQKHALCTYKDPDLPPARKFDEAIRILESVQDVGETQDPETLGLAGAIFKRKWEVDGNKEHLVRSLGYYRRGYAIGPEHDQGYTGINAAYVLDLLAHVEQREAGPTGPAPPSVDARRDEARRIRKELTDKLEAMWNREEQAKLAGNYWFLVTLAEAYYGQGQYKQAAEWLARTPNLSKVPPWQRETTARQLASLARMQCPERNEAMWERSEAWDALRQFLGRDIDGLRSVFLGKVGLALSGGGFRASLFHIGVLAKLAEMDLLRHVEVLSCVSGGSIVGAYYYLELRRLLENTPDGQITQDDYIAIVRRIADRFVEGVQRNIRMRVAGSFLANLRMIVQLSFSRTERIGELFEEELYSLVDDDGGRRRWINDLFVSPRDEAQFSVKHDNWKRANKVPVLILNATSLNTGHAWQFTASFMGEPPAAINTEIDSNPRLRRMYYWQAPRQHRRVRLGTAVGASAAVPGLFEPVSLPGLYDGRTVRLVDGGVYDNQGLAGLLEQDCTVILISDGSGQLNVEKKPSRLAPGVLSRSNSTLMARVRTSQHEGLTARFRSGLLRAVMFVHLKYDLDSAPVDWIGCQERPEVEDTPPRDRGVWTRYGILKSAQRLLADIRTDLDSFNDTEAFALMTSAYRQTGYAIDNQLKGYGHPCGRAVAWNFLAVDDKLCAEDAFAKIRPLLEVACHRGFKIWRISRPLQVIGAVLGMVATIGLLAICVRYPLAPLFTLGLAGVLVAVGAVGSFLGRWLMPSLRLHEALAKIATHVGLSLVGWPVCRSHLKWFDRWYLERGRILRDLTHEETLQWIRQHRAWRRFHKTKAIWAREVRKDEIGREFRTADHATHTARADWWLCVGIAGEPWFQEPGKIVGKYDAGEELEKKFPFDAQPCKYREYHPKPGACNWAAQIVDPAVKGFRIRPDYDPQKPLYSPAGGYVVRPDTEDPYAGEPGDVWLVQQPLFESTYEAVPTQFS